MVIFISQLLISINVPPIHHHPIPHPLIMDHHSNFLEVPISLFPTPFPTPNPIVPSYNIIGSLPHTVLYLTNLAEYKIKKTEMIIVMQT